MSAGASATVRLAVLVALWTAIAPGPAIANDFSTPPRPTHQSVLPDFSGHAQLVVRDPSRSIATVAPPRSGPYDPSGLSAPPDRPRTSRL